MAQRAALTREIEGSIPSSPATLRFATCVDTSEDPDRDDSEDPEDFNDD